MLFYIYYKMFREMSAPWLVRASSLYFHKARALRHTSVNTETILHFFYKITNERGTKTVFTYAHVKWFHGQSERAYYLNYFIMRYNARSLRQRYERAQFTIHFTNEVKKLVPRALLSYISTWEFLRTLEKCEKHSPSARACPHFSSVHKKFPRAYRT